MTDLVPSLAAVAAILLCATGVGYAAGAALVPPGSSYRLERGVWGFGLGLLLLAGLPPLCFLLGVRPAWIPFLATAAVLIAAARLLTLRSAAGSGEARPPAGDAPSPAFLRPILWALLAAGTLLYALRALTEPMWATDFLAIWGWKGKTIFGAAAVPRGMWLLPDLGFTHPEYPLGLPFLYAGISFLLGRWDDHATALVFCFFQIATLALLGGWLRRQGAAPPVPLAAAAALSLFEPLYRAFTTGMAEVPLSLFLLLLGTSVGDALDGGRGASRRLALASAGAAGLKNEGLFAAGAAALVALGTARLPWRDRLRIASVSLLPALAIVGLHRAWRGPLPLRDFRFDPLLSPELPTRLVLGLRTIATETLLPAAPGLMAFALLLAVGRRSAAGDRLLAFAAVPLAAYLLLPAFCVWGPEWLARTAFARTAAALAPLAAAGAALRLTPVFSSSGGSSGSSADLAASRRHLARPTPANPAS